MISLFAATMLGFGVFLLIGSDRLLKAMCGAFYFLLGLCLSLASTQPARVMNRTGGAVFLMLLICGFITIAVGFGVLKSAHRQGRSQRLDRFKEIRN